MTGRTVGQRPTALRPARWRPYRRSVTGRGSVTPGSFVWLPRDVPHTFRVETPTARVLTVCVPGGREDFFSAIGRPAAHLGLPPAPEGPRDMDDMAGHAYSYGVEILGPPMS